MGGSGVMRAASKVAGIGVYSGFRGASAEQAPFAPACRKVAVRPPSATVYSSGELGSDDLIAHRALYEDGSIQRPYFGIEDWVFARAEEEIEGLVPNAGGDRTPRLVFGGAPTLQEAQEATAELKEAIEKAYPFSPASFASTGSSTANRKTRMLPFCDSEVPGEVTYVSSQTTVAPPMPTPAIQAFKFLSETPAAQTVVASIACDPNVWNAVLQNGALVEFLDLQKSSTDQFVKESVADIDCHHEQTPTSFYQSSCSGESVSGNGSMGFVANIKLKVINMLSDLYDFFQNLFGDQMTEKTSSADDKSAKNNLMGGAFGASVVGLAIMVILLVVMKRVHI